MSVVQLCSELCTSVLTVLLYRTMCVLYYIQPLQAVFPPLQYGLYLDIAMGIQRSKMVVCCVSDEVGKM